MTDDTTATVEADEVDSDEGEAGDEGTVESAGAGGVAVDDPGHHGDEMPGWKEQYLLPLVLPLMIVVGVAFFAINLSRVFLAASSAGAVTVAVIVTLAILIGAALLSAAPKMRTSSIMLIVCGGLLVVLMAGTLTLGESEEEHEAEGEFPAVTPEVDVPVDSGNLFFAPEELEAETGIFSITMTNIQSGQHTFVIETPGPVTSKPELAVANEGDVDSYGVFVGDSGDYVFFCSIPGHRAAGMEGVLLVSGDPATIEEAAAELGPAEGETGEEAGTEA